MWSTFSSVAGGGARGQSVPLDSEKDAKNRKKEGNIGKKKKSGRKGKNLEGSFTLPLLTDRAGYATEFIQSCNVYNYYGIP